MNRDNLNISPNSRIALGIEYDGTNYCGWQSQSYAAVKKVAGKSTLLPTIQHALESALAKVATHPVKTCCAGRTDTGVHALGQVVHFDTAQKRSMQAWTFGTNSYLPPDIRVHWAVEVPPSFHARFTATTRHYRYIIYNNPTASAILHHRSFWYHQPLNEASMQEAAHYLIGEHDFSSFRASSCQSRSVNRNLKRIHVQRVGSMIMIDISANAFLHHMVRNIVGTLLPVGKGDKEPAWVGRVLLARSRSEGGVMAPATGLHLMAVEYPAEYSLPHQKSHHNFHCCAIL